MRSGTIAIIGRTNVGKSTFLNAALGEKLAIVSPQPQTTRDELLGVLHRDGVELVFTDTPGLHRPKTELGRRMNARALDTARSHDVVLFLTDVARLTRARAHRPDADPIAADDRRLLTILRQDVPCVLAINKVDLVKDKSRLLPLMQAFEEAHPFAAIVPTSLRSPRGCEPILDLLSKLVPEGEAAYDADTITDKPTNFFVREFVREQVLLQTRSEVPHAVAVTVDRFEQSAKHLSISATIHVEKVGQRSILVGRGGARIKAIGIAAREELERFLGANVYLELFVRVTERWKDVPRQLQELGYEGQGGRSLQQLLPTSPKRRPKTKTSGGESPKRRSAGARAEKPKSAPRPSGKGASPRKRTTKPRG